MAPKSRGIYNAYKRHKIAIRSIKSPRRKTRGRLPTTFYDTTHTISRALLLLLDARDERHPAIITS